VAVGDSQGVQFDPDHQQHRHVGQAGGEVIGPVETVLGALGCIHAGIGLVPDHPLRALRRYSSQSRERGLSW